MTDFTKTKISFALALLGTLFALHPFMEKVQDDEFDYLGVPLRLTYAFATVAILLAVCVYSYALALVSERPSWWLERVGNWTYALALIIFPLYGGLYVAHLAAAYVGQGHLKLAIPAVALGIGGFWLLVSLLVAWRLRSRLGDADRRAKLRHLAEHELNSLRRAKEIMDHKHYDLAVVESWRAVEARLRGLLLARHIHPRHDDHESLIVAGERAGLIRETALGLIRDLHKHWSVAVSVEAVSEKDAEEAMAGARALLAMLPVSGHRHSHRAHA